jgi:hypothetical protein
MNFIIKEKITSGTLFEVSEFRLLKSIFVGFFNKNENSNISFDIKIKKILKTFIKNIKLVNKVIEIKDKFLFQSVNIDCSLNYKFNFNNHFGVNNNMPLFQFFLFTYFNKDIINMCLLKEFYFFKELNNIYKRFSNFFLTEEKFNMYLIVPKKNKTTKNLKKIIYSVQIFNKMIQLITKIVLVNSKYFFLNNIKYNYTLLKLCDKTMKLVNSILLFCLLCDINIPYYCFHSDLSIAGNCRMCLVQLDTSLKPIASCAVSIGINSTIYTNTKIIQKAREGVLEFLLINHPLDCPICDQGGECDLQEQFITYGNDRGRFLKRMI